MKNGKFLTQPLTHKSKHIIEGIIATNRLNMWASVPGEGKSLVGTGLGYSIPYEAPFLNMNTTGGNVMFIDSENRYDILRSRAIKIKNGYEKDGYKMKGEVDFQHYSGFLLDDKTTWKQIEAAIKALEPSLIVIDHLACFHHQDEDKEKSMKRVTTAIEELMAIKNSSVLVLHHFNKNEGSFFKRLRGSSALYAKTDVACEVRTLSKTDDGLLEKVGLIFQPRKDVTPIPCRIKIEEGQDWIQLVHDGAFVPLDDAKLDRITHDIYHTFLDDKDTKKVTDVKDILAGRASERETRDCLYELHEKRGLLGLSRIGKGGEYHYYLANPPKPCPWCMKI